MTSENHFEVTRNLVLYWVEGWTIVFVATIGNIVQNTLAYFNLKIVFTFSFKKGFCVNVFAIWKLSCGLRNAKRFCFHKLLLFLSICDLLHLVLTLACFSLPQISTTYKNEFFIFAIPYFIPLAQMTLCCSRYVVKHQSFWHQKVLVVNIAKKKKKRKKKEKKKENSFIFHFFCSWTTVSLTIERYFSLCDPFLRYRFMIKARHFVLSVITFSVLYNIPRFFEWMTYSALEEISCWEKYIMGK